MAMKWPVVPEPRARLGGLDEAVDGLDVTVKQVCGAEGTSCAHVDHGSAGPRRRRPDTGLCWPCIRAPEAVASVSVGGVVGCR